MPKRIQRRRTKGWRAPKGAIYVGRPTKWGNPYTGDQAVPLFRATVPITLISEAKKELRGFDVMCWCPLDQPCHADVLLELANR